MVALAEARRARAAARRDRADRPAAVRQFRGRRLRGAPRRSRRAGETQARDRRPRRRRAVRRRGSWRRARRSASSPARRCRRAPTRCSCRRTAARRAASSIVPPGLKRGANRRLAGEDVRARRGGAAGRPAAAAAGCRAGGGGRADAGSPCAAACASRCSRPATRSSSPAAAAASRRCYDANRYLLAGLLRRLGAEVTDLGILRDDPEKLARGDRGRGRAHDLVLTSGGVSTGEADHVRSAVEKVGRLVFWRVAIKPGRPVAMGAACAGGAHSSACRAIRSPCS